ncbi:MCE family protein [Paraburkholderia sp. Tr-20389]|uniref:PqiB family protein n=1 Tax=Paraburkholderia sp. Tr-20389 TaxID=2703903 RepID=UPI0019801203|nr:MlaD family protein [Paraburkholderia sp. Tr-20389]MBN3757661.1 MCE family protein [Paraburkholderia sp. Tr-20389]
MSGAPSAVWLLPIAALLVSGALLIRTGMQRGPRITISFMTAESLEAGKTRVRYRDVDIGRLQDLHLSADRTRVLAEVQLDDSAKQFATCDARYWVVRPRIGMTGVSGLSTAISGAYIAADIGQASRSCRAFTGLETPPFVTSDQKGKRFVLHADSLGSLTAGSPVLFRRVQAGQVLDYALSVDGSEVVVDVFVNAPYDRYVTSGTVWWQASGIDVSFGSDGFRLDTQSVASLLSGGIAFDNAKAASASRQAVDGASFVLSTGRTDATQSAEDGTAARVFMRFGQSLRGLSIGAPVDFHGVELGRVTAIDVDFDPATGRIDMIAALDLYPTRLGRRYRQALGNGDSEAGRRLLHKLIADGLRGQLRMGSVLTGQRYVALDFFPRAPKVSIDTQRTRVELPTVPNTLEELQDQLAGIVDKLDRVPFDQIGRSLDRALQTSASLFQRIDTELVPEARETLTAAQQSFNAANATLAQDSPLQSDLHAALSELRRTLTSLNSLADYLQRHPESIVWGKSSAGAPEH